MARPLYQLLGLDLLPDAPLLAALADSHGTVARYRAVAQQELDRHRDRRLDGLLTADVLQQLGDPGSLPSGDRAIWDAHELGRRHRLPLRSHLDAGIRQNYRTRHDALFR